MSDRHENKAQICDHLAGVLRMTRQYSNLVAIDYQQDDFNEKFAVCIFRTGHGQTYHKAINITMDSGSAMIRDIVRGLA